MVLRSPVVVGRAAELATVRLALQNPRPDGRVQVVVVEGDAGVGKSRFVAEIVSGADPRTRCVWGSAFPGGSDIPMLPWADALRDFVRQWGSQELTAVTGAAATDFAVFVPELGAPVRGDGARVRDLLPWLWERLAENAPVLVVLEDMHVADPGTWAVLLRLARHGRGDLTVVVTGRTGQDDRDLAVSGRWREVATELRRGGAVSVHLPALDRHEATELADRLVAAAQSAPGGQRARVQAPGVIEALVDGCAGNPFVLEQLVQMHLSGRLPDALPGDPAWAAVEALTPTASDLFVALAILGGEVDHGMLRLLVPVEEPRLLEALRETLDAGVVVVRDGQRYRVRHGLLAESARARLLPVERQRWHAVVARALQTRPDDPRAVTALPAHWEAAGDAGRALAAAVVAGRLSSYSPVVAAIHYGRAVALWSTVDDAESLTGTTYDELVELAATACAQTGDTEAAVELAGKWLAGAGPESDPSRASRMSLLVASRGEWTLPAAEVEAAFGAAVSLAQRAGGANLSASLTGLARHLASLDRNAEAEPLAREALRSAVDGPEVAYAGATLGAILGHLGDHDGGVAALGTALIGLDRLEQAQQHARTAFELVWTQFYAGQATTAVERALTTSSELGRTGLVLDVGAALLAGAAQIRIWLGQWDQARELIERGEQADPVGLGATTRLAARAELALRSGEPALARGLYEEYLSHWDALGLRSFDHLGLSRCAESAAEDGDLVAAWALLAEGLTAIGGADTHYERAMVARGGAHVLAQSVRLGKAPPQDLLSGVDELVAVVGANPRDRPGSVPSADLLTAQAARAQAGHEPSARRWADAADAWAVLGFPWWESMCRLRYAEALLITRGARGAAAPVVARARAVAVGLGAAGLVRQADQLARGAGLELTHDRSTTSTRAAEDPDGLAVYALTPREHEVFALLVAGRSNRAIASELFISEKTASVHVSNILAKLGVRSRLEAVTLLRPEAGP